GMCPVPGPIRGTDKRTQPMPLRFFGDSGGNSLRRRGLSAFPTGVRGGLSQGRGAVADSSALGAEPSALAQGLGAADFPAPPCADERRANCPRLYTAPYTASEKVPVRGVAPFLEIS